MKLYRTDSSFLLFYGSKYYDKITYLDSGGLARDWHCDGDNDNSKTLIAESNCNGDCDFPLFQGFDRLTVAFHSFNNEPLKFSYDTSSNELVCEYYDNGTKVYRIKCETLRQQFKDKYPGPYKRVYAIGDSDCYYYWETVDELDYVYEYHEWDYVVVSADNLQLFQDVINEKGWTIEVVDEIDDF